MPSFSATHTIPFPTEEVFAWHERPGALQRLTPPWVNVKVVEQSGGIRDGARVVLRVSKGPLDVRWELEHEGYEKDRQFCDRQVRGPLGSWFHIHRFEPTSDGGTQITDEVEWNPPLGSAAALFTTAAVRRELSTLFAFRARRLQNDLSLHQRYQDLPRRTVAITGSSGLIGSKLRHVLTTGGHTALPIVRDPGVGGASVYWNWKKGEIDLRALEPARVVVNLGGEPLTGLRWTAEKKRAIWDSRVKGTEFLARTMAGFHSGPETLVNASAVGFYGDRGNEIVDETSKPGRGFLADLCKAWEEATARADRSGIRVAKVRIGVALSAEGGALGSMLLPFKMGLGGRIGSGKQYVPWVDVDDVVGLFYHIAMTDEARGVFNATAEHPVPQATFSAALGRILGRPTIVPVPSLAVNALFGEMGKELLLRGQRTKPERTLSSGYSFLFDGLEESLRFQLGKLES